MDKNKIRRELSKRREDLQKNVSQEPVTSLYFDSRKDKTLKTREEGGAQIIKYEGEGVLTVEAKRYALFNKLKHFLKLLKFTTKYHYKVPAQRA